MSFPVTQDPVLRAYSVKFPTSPGDGRELICYDVSDWFSPIAIRDQIVRACSVVNRAIAHNIISRERRLMIVGGGHAGVAAAITAVRRGVPTTLIERSTVLGKLEKSGRYVSLVQYDWAADHWESEMFPWYKDCLSIRITLFDGPASDLTGGLKTEYQAERKKDPVFFEVREHREIVPGSWNFLPPSDREKFPKIQVSINIKDQNPPWIYQPDPFGMALICTGFRGEKVSLSPTHPYAGFEFWEMGKYDYAEKGFVLIGGSGDGALQDFLLLVTNKKSAREIYLGLGLTESERSELEREIFKAEEQLRREEVWQDLKNPGESTQAHICSLYRSIHDVHSRLAARLLTRTDITIRIEGMLRLNAANNIHLAHGCTHLQAYYALNRFLAILIGNYIERTYATSRDARPVFMPNRRVRNVKSNDTAMHTCARDIDECVKYSHVVELDRDYECTNQAPTDNFDEKPFRYVLLRFGLNNEGREPFFGPGTGPVFPGLQIIPNKLP